MSLSLGKKIAVVATPPLIAFTIMAGWNLYQRQADVRAYSAMEQTATLVEATAALIQEVQSERTLSAAYMGKEVTMAELQSLREKVDFLAKGFHHILEDSAMDTARRTAGLVALQALATLRAGVNSGTSTEQQVLDGFLPVINPLMDLEVDLSHLADVGEMKARVRAISTIEHAKDYASRIRVRMMDYLGGNEPLKVAQFDSFVELWASMEGPLKDSNLSLTDAGREHLKTFLTINAGWAKMRQTYELISLRAAVGHYNQDAKQFLRETTIATEELTQILKDETSALSRDAQARRQETWAAFSTLGLLMLAMIFGLGFALWYVNSAILKPILGSIAHLSTSSLQVGQASQELQHASEQVASGATEAASSLQETTSSLEEINSMIQSNANNASKASDISTTSEAVAQKGKDSVQEVARAISGIQQSINSLIQHIGQSNTRIGQIAQVISEIGNKTKVINDIVFQTKLLAFNASVEAARAGEHGRGFAVVAEEVGNLAQMSGNAAKEITAMLDSSVDQVKSVVTETQSNMDILVKQGTESIDNGVKTTKQCEEVLNEIVAKAVLLKNVIGDISRACMEQAAGTQQITSAISELDQVTHLNATSSGQVSQSTENLTQQSLALREVVKSLTAAVLGGADSGASSRAAAQINKPSKVVSMRPRATSQSKRPTPKASDFDKIA